MISPLNNCFTSWPFISLSGYSFHSFNCLLTDIILLIFSIAFTVFIQGFQSAFKIALLLYRRQLIKQREIKTGKVKKPIDVHPLRPLENLYIFIHLWLTLVRQSRRYLIEWEVQENLVMRFALISKDWCGSVRFEGHWYTKAKDFWPG